MTALPRSFDEIFKRAGALHDNIASSHPKLARGVVWCTLRCQPARRLGQVPAHRLAALLRRDHVDRQSGGTQSSGAIAMSERALWILLLAGLVGFYLVLKLMLGVQ